MAYHSRKTEHAGAKNSGAKSGYWGHRADAKKESSRQRRIYDREAVADGRPCACGTPGCYDLPCMCGAADCTSGSGDHKAGS